jgi:hypothetical protein
MDDDCNDSDGATGPPAGEPLTGASATGAPPRGVPPAGVPPRGVLPTGVGAQTEDGKPAPHAQLQKALCGTSSATMLFWTAMTF